MDWFLYDNGLRHERVNLVLYFLLLYYYTIQFDCLHHIEINESVMQIS